MDFAPHRPYLAAMLRSLLMILLVFGLGLPALAAIPAPPQGEPVHCASAHEEAEQDAPPQSPAKHDCVGCIAPYACTPPAVDRIALPALRQTPGLVASLEAIGTLPDPPPPRD